MDIVLDLSYELNEGDRGSQQGKAKYCWIENGITEIEYKLHLKLEYLNV